MKNSFFISYIFAILLLLSPAFAHADGLFQHALITVNPDFSAIGTWSIPVDTRGSNGREISFEEFKNFGSTGLMSYTAKKVANEDGELPMTTIPEGVSVLNMYKTSAAKGIKNIDITYSIKTGLTTPLPIYEFWVAGGAYFNSPTLKINFPKGWKVLSVWPEAEVNGEQISVTYPTKTSYIYPVLVVFQPTSLPIGYTVATVGKYTVVGSTSDVNTLKQALASLTFLDSLMKNTLGYDVPQNTIIYAGDMTNVDTGYEAVALAAKPNLVLYNKDILQKQSQTEIQTTLVHEIAHLVVESRGLFKGATYIAPWFKEGLAVFVENQARANIYSSSNSDAQIIEDQLGRTHMLSSTQLKNKYSKPFDYLIEGSQTYSTRDSYSHSGAIITNFYNKVGVNGMKKLFDALLSKDSAQLSETYDSEAILAAMSQVSNMTKDDLLFPFKNSNNFEQDAKSLVYPNITTSSVETTANYIKTKIPQYIQDSTSSTAIITPVSSSSSQTATSTPPSISTCVKITKNLSRGMKGDEVSTLQKYLITKGLLPVGSVLGNFGPQTEKAVQMLRVLLVKTNTLSNLTSGIVDANLRTILSKGCTQ